ncbi:MAG: hypothetical protein ACOH1H_14365 [Brevundimonas sp.]
MTRILLSVGTIALAGAPVVAAAQQPPQVPTTLVPDIVVGYRAPAGETFLVERAELSPDGTRVAYVAALANVRKLRVQSLDGRLNRTVDLTRADVRDIVWAGDDHVVVTLARQGIVELPVDNALFTAAAFNVVTDSWENLLFNRTDRERTGGRVATRLKSFPTVWPIIFERPIVRTGPDGVGVYVDTINFDGSCRYDLYRVDLDTGAARLSERGTQRVQAFVIGPDGEPLALMQGGRVRMFTGVGWHTLDLSGLGEPLELLGGGLAPGSVLVRTGTDEAARLYEVSGGAAGTITPFPVSGLTAAEPVYDDQTGRLLGLEGRDADGRTVQQFLDPQLAGAWPSVVAAFPGETVLLASWSADFSKLVVYAEGADPAADSAAYHLVDLAAGSATLLAPSYRTRRDDDLDRTGTLAPTAIRRAASARIEDPRMLCVPGAAESVY